jgi:hypothetical protein
MNEHVQNLKAVVDAAVQRGLFVNAESVENTMRSFRHIDQMVREYELIIKARLAAAPATDNSEPSNAEKIHQKT